MKKFNEYVKERSAAPRGKKSQAKLLPCSEDELSNKLDIAIKEELGASLSQEKIDRLSERIIRALAGDVVYTNAYNKRTF